jgi:hypothetical protein
MLRHSTQRNRFEEVVVALSLVCELPVDVVERALLDDQGEMIIIVTKAANLSWAATKELLAACRGNRISADEMERASKNFSTISASTARQVLEFYQRRSSRAEAVGG